MHPIFPDATIWALALPGGFLLTVLLAAAGLPFMALAGQTLATVKRRTFYNKCGRQLAMLAAILAPLSLALAGLTMFRAVQMDPALLVGPIRLPLFALLAILTSTSIFAVLYFFTWKRLASLPLVQQLFGLIAGMGMIKAIFFTLAIGRAMLVPGHPLPATGSPFAIMMALAFPTGHTLLWASFLLALCAVFAAAGCYAMAWLVLRRQQDDFGRDYYTFTMPWCARWAFGGSIVAIAPGAYLIWCVIKAVNPTFVLLPLSLPAMLPPLLPMALALLCPVFTAICAARVSHSVAPMRHKLAIAFARILLVLASAGELATLMSMTRHMA